MNIEKFTKDKQELINQWNEMKRVRDNRLEYKMNIKKIGVLNGNNSKLDKQIRQQKDKNLTIQSKIKALLKSLNDLEIQYNCLINSNDPQNKRQILDIKATFIQNHFNTILNERLPELKQVYTEDIPKEDQNEFFNMIRDNVIVYYQEYDEITLEKKDNKELMQPFRISKLSSFHSLKQNATSFWAIVNPADYTLTDEWDGVIPDEITIYEYFSAYSHASPSLHLVHIKKLNANLSLTSKQDIHIRKLNQIRKNEVSNTNDEMENNFYEQIQEKHNKFDNNYQGLAPYMIAKDNANKGQYDENKDNRNRSKDEAIKFWTLCVILAFLALNCLFIFQSTKDALRNYTKIAHVKHLFNNSNVNSYASFYRYVVKSLGYNLFTFKSADQLDIKLVDSVYNGIFIEINKVMNMELTQNIDTNDNSFLNKDFVKSINLLIHKNIKFTVMSTIYVGLSMVQAIPCTTTDITRNFVQGNTCYGNLYHKHKMKDKLVFDNSLVSYVRSGSTNKPLSVWLNSVSEFKDTNETKIHLDLNELSGYIDGTGYQFEINPRTLDIGLYMKFMAVLIPIGENFQQSIPNTAPPSSNPELDTLSFYFLVDQPVRNIQFLFTLYYPSDQVWISCQIGFDNLSTGLFRPASSSFRAFRPNIYSDILYLIIDIFRVILALILLKYNISHWISKRDPETSIIKHLFNYHTTFNIILILTILISVILKLLLLMNNEKTFFENIDTIYIDSYSIARNYNNIFIVEAFVFSLIMMKLFTFLNLFVKVSLMFKVINEVFVDYIVHLVMIILLLIGFGFIMNILYGPYLDAYYTFTGAFYQVLLLITGFFNVRELLDYSEGWTIIVLFVFYMFMIMLTLGIFIGICAEKLRSIIISEGYPFETEDNFWNYERIKAWFCPCGSDVQAKK